MKTFEIACLHMWERSWLAKMQAVDLNPWTSGRLTNPKERTKMSMQCNSAVRLIGPARSTSESPTMNENPSTVGLPIRHHQHHGNRLHETRSRRVMGRKSRGQEKASPFAAGVVERATLPGSAHQQMIARTLMKSEQGRPVMLTVISLVWIGAMTPLRPSTQRQNSWWRGGKELLAFVDSGAVDKVFPGQCVPSIPWRRPPSRRAELVSMEQTGHTSSTMGSGAFGSRQALEAI